jgi:hypothetical protein
MKIFTNLKGLIMRVAVLMSNILRRRKDAENSSVAKEGREESEGRLERKRSSKLQRRNSKSSSKVRGQPKKSKLSSKNGGNARTGKGLKGKTNKTSSQPKSVGSIKQSRRKTKGSSNLTKK